MSNKEKASNSDEARLFELFNGLGEKIVEVYPQLTFLSEGQLDAFAVYATILLDTGEMKADATLAALNEALCEALDEYAIELAARSKASNNAEGMPTIDVSQQPVNVPLTLEALHPATSEKSVVPSTLSTRHVERRNLKHPLNEVWAGVLRLLAVTN